MDNPNIRTINGKRYIATKQVKFMDVIYQEYCNADPTKPHTIYIIQGTDKIADYKTHVALREKYALDKKTLYGNPTLYSGMLADTETWEMELKTVPCFADVEVEYKDTGSYNKIVNGISFNVKTNDCVVKSGEYKGQKLSTLHVPDEIGREQGFRTDRECDSFYLEKANEFIKDFYENDIKEFASNIVREYGNVFGTHNIENPQEWLEQRMQKIKYNYDTEIGASGNFDCKTSQVNFSSLLGFTNQKALRTHELIHALSSEIEAGRGRFGIMYYQHNDEQSLYVQTGIEQNRDEKGLYSESGRALNEGITNSLATKLTGEKIGSYYCEVEIANMLEQLVSAEKIFESVLFGAETLISALERKGVSKDEYAQILYGLDEYQWLHFKIPEYNVYADDEIDQTAYKQSLKHLWEDEFTFDPKVYEKITGKPFVDKREKMRETQKIALNKSTEILQSKLQINEQEINRS
jgi:hypothetical protein